MLYNSNKQSFIISVFGVINLYLGKEVHAIYIILLLLIELYCILVFLIRIAYLQ